MLSIVMIPIFQRESEFGKALETSGSQLQLKWESPESTSHTLERKY